LLPSIAVGYEDIENSSQVVMGSSFYTPLVVHGRALCYSPAKRDLLIDRLHITLPPGGACIIQGANASGKSTFLRDLLNLGEHVSGWLQRNSTIHYLGENDKDNFRSDLTLYGCLKLFCRNAGMPYQEVSWALRAVNLFHVHDQKYSHLSQGQRKRASLARLLVVPRALWLLDEPTLALDTNSLTILEQIIHFHRMQGGCVVAATHTHIDIPDATRIRLGDLETL